jgi:hypothetical protein
MHHISDSLSLIISTYVIFRAVILISVTLHPFEYDPVVNYSHKFMVQSLFIPDGTSTEIEDLVRILSNKYEKKK